MAAPSNEGPTCHQLVRAGVPLPVSRSKNSGQKSNSRVSTALCRLSSETPASPPDDLSSNPPRPAPPSPVDTDPVLSQLVAIYKKTDRELHKLQRDRRKIKAFTFAQLLNVRSLYKCSQCRGVGHFEVECPTPTDFFDDDEEQSNLWVPPVAYDDKLISVVDSAVYKHKASDFGAHSPVGKEMGGDKIIFWAQPPVCDEDQGKVSFFMQPSTSEVNSTPNPCNPGLETCCDKSCWNFEYCELSLNRVSTSLNEIGLRLLLYDSCVNCTCELKFCPECCFKLISSTEKGVFNSARECFKLPKGNPGVWNCEAEMRLLIYDKVSSVPLAPRCSRMELIKGSLNYISTVLESARPIVVACLSIFDKSPCVNKSALITWSSKNLHRVVSFPGFGSSLGKMFRIGSLFAKLFRIENELRNAYDILVCDCHLPTEFQPRRLIANSNLMVACVWGMEIGLRSLLRDTRPACDVENSCFELPIALFSDTDKDSSHYALFVSKLGSSRSCLSTIYRSCLDKCSVRVDHYARPFFRTSEDFISVVETLAAFGISKQLHKQKSQTRTPTLPIDEVSIAPTKLVNLFGNWHYGPSYSPAIEKQTCPLIIVETDPRGDKFYSEITRSDLLVTINFTIWPNCDGICCCEYLPFEFSFSSSYRLWRIPWPPRLREPESAGDEICHGVGTRQSEPTGMHTSDKCNLDKVCFTHCPYKSKLDLKIGSEQGFDYPGRRHLLVPSYESYLLVCDENYCFVCPPVEVALRLLLFDKSCLVKLVMSSRNLFCQSVYEYLILPECVLTEESICFDKFEFKSLDSDKEVSRTESLSSIIGDLLLFDRAVQSRTACFAGMILSLYDSCVHCTCELNSLKFGMSRVNFEMKKMDLDLLICSSPVLSVLKAEMVLLDNVDLLFATEFISPCVLSNGNSSLIKFWWEVLLCKLSDCDMGHSIQCCIFHACFDVVLVYLSWIIIVKLLAGCLLCLTSLGSNFHELHIARLIGQCAYLCIGHGIMENVELAIANSGLFLCFKNGAICEKWFGLVSYSLCIYQWDMSFLTLENSPKSWRMMAKHPGQLSLKVNAGQPWSTTGQLLVNDGQWPEFRPEGPIGKSIVKVQVVIYED